jgi:glycerophosphoryl diester phosphodiesterase
MANKIIHKHSSVITDNKAKLPTIEQLEYGELAINYADGVETIAFKNSKNEIVEIKSNKYFEKVISNYITDDELSQKGFLDGEETSEELDDIETNTYVKYVAQTLTEEQQKQARLNIGINEVSSINYDLNVKAINHRGYSYESPENTIPAYIMSKDKGFTYVEGDVAFTKDNVAVLLHDNTIDRTSNGSGKITDFQYQELLQYDFGSWFSSEYEGVKIPTFKEWILLCKNLGLHPYIELKSSGSYTQAQITQVVNEVAACGMKGKVTYISFNNTFLGYVKNADASARLGFLTSTLSSGNITTAKNLKTTSNEVFLDAKLSTLKDSVVDSCISNNIPLEVWTVNTEDEIIKMHSYISGVTSDYLVAGRTLYNNALVYVPPTSSWIPTTGISLDKTSLTFSSFDTITLIATVEPSNSSEEIVWKSSNTSIATVVNGVVTPLSEGSCVITVTSGEFSDSCSVNIAFTKYNITRNLTGCSLSNTEDNVLISKAYYGEVIPNEGYSLKNGTVKITMGGVDITSSAYSNGIINIENVTGDIVITVVGVVVPVYSITRNLVGCTSNKDTVSIGEGNPYNEVFTAIEDYRLNGASVTITMGDTDISSMYNDGVLSIPEVTGNIVININAELIPVYSITRNLVNCSTDSSVTTIKDGESHNENILANEGYTLRGGNIVITMGGIDISSSLSYTGILSINAVTGNIVINVESV